MKYSETDAKVDKDPLPPFVAITSHMLAIKKYSSQHEFFHSRVPSQCKIAKICTIRTKLIDENERINSRVKWQCSGSNTPYGLEDAKEHFARSGCTVTRSTSNREEKSKLKQNLRKMYPTAAIVIVEQILRVLIHKKGLWKSFVTISGGTRGAMGSQLDVILLLSS